MKTPLEIVIGIEEQLKIVDDSLNKIQVLKLTRYMVHQMRDVIPMYTGNLNPKWKLYDEAIELAECRLNAGQHQ
jgi:hypothetical protein